MADVVVAADCSAVTPSAVLDRGDKCPNPAEKNRVLAKFFDSFVVLLLVSLPVDDVKYHDLRRPRTMSP